MANKGYKILFKSSNKATDKPNSYIMNADGTSVQPFIDSDQYKRFGPQKREHPFPEAETVWSPNGTRSIKNTYQLGNIDPVFQSPLGEATGNVNWSPDGRYIVFPVYDRKFTGDQGGGKLTSQIYVAATQYLGACPLDVPVELLYQLPEWVLEIRP